MFARRLAAEIAPFAATALLGFALVPIHNHVDWTRYVIAAAMTVAVIVLSLLGPWPTEHRVLRAVPPLLFLASIALLREAGGGTASGVGALALLPVLWVALYGSRTELLLILAGICAFFLAPALLFGDGAYPFTVWRLGVIFAVASTILGVAVQNLVVRVRSHADALAVRERDLEAMAALSRTLSDSHDARDRICAAACELSGAHFAVLLERQDSGTLAWTAGAGLTLPAETFERAAWATAAFASGSGTFVDHPDRRPDADPALLAATEHPAAILFEPVHRGRAVGVLVVGWRSPPTDASRATDLVRLLASEAAFAIERADLLGRLTEIAMTDELTGLPNRRSWDRRLEQAIRDAEPVCVAMLDLDLFKDYNDNHGHQAGDRLLKEAAAAWRAELREHDTIARYGGEEFTVMLGGTDLDAAQAIVDRLRAATPHGQSCSAGLARRERGEAADTLIGRADEALYTAKRAGRDRTVIASARAASRAG